MKTLLKYRNNIYSQNGEDGVVEEILNRLEIKTGRFVEVGAWDGKHLSNTYNLLCRGWSGLDIEGDPERFKELIETAKGFPKLHILNACVSTEGEFSLDNLFLMYQMPEDFELLSVDIDSKDYHVWDSIKKYKPKIVIIEIESSIAPGVEQISSVGRTSFPSMLKLGQEKGYTLVCHTGNMIFIRNDLVDKLNLPKKETDNPKKLFLWRWVIKRYIHNIFKLNKQKPK